MSRPSVVCLSVCDVVAPRHRLELFGYKIIFAPSNSQGFFSVQFYTKVQF